MRRRTWTTLFGLALVAANLIACGGTKDGTSGPTLFSPTSTLPPSETPRPTATEAPLAARVNGEPITLEAFQKEIVRFEAAQAAIGQDVGAPGDYRARVLDDLISRELVAQAAAREGIAITDADLETQVQAVVAGAGGQEAFNAWLAANQYTADEFRGELRAGLLAQALAEKVANVPDTAEQAHARHILVPTEGEAQELLARVRGNSDFGDMARQYSQDLSTRPNGGELGWFARGQLAVPEVEEAAFNLQPGEVSGVVHSALGYHIVQTLERDPARPLDLAFLATLRQRAFDEWLANERAKAVVEVLVK